MLFGLYRAALYVLSPAECRETEISIHKINNQDILCVFPDNSRIQMILSNTGSQRIDDAVVEITGKKETLTKTISGLNLIQGDVATVSVEYSNEYGDVKGVTISPVVESEGKDVSCSLRKISFNDIRDC